MAIGRATAQAAAVGSEQASGDPLRRWRLATTAALLALAGLAWAASALRMGGMDAGPGSDPGELGFYVVTWVVMMAAMMFPSISPMVLMYGGLHRGRRRQGKHAPAGATGLFVAGYLVVWTAAGIAGYGLLEAGRALDAGTLAWDAAGRWLAVGVLVAAAAYELTGLKDACLRRCRGPLSFLLEHWRDGRGGALRLGVLHGAWCVGCCWALMAALFALGAMSLVWMAVIGALIAAEKLAPRRRTATAAVAGFLAALAVGVALAPARVPALTLPSADPGGAMMEMNGDDPGRPMR